nr:RNA-directed DNA polymerase, eukaryota [Tanacetum cinerariifolium]
QKKNKAFSKNNGDKTTNFIPSQKADHVGSSQNKKSYASSLNGDRDIKVEKQVTVVKGNTLSNVPLTPSLITPALVLDDSCVSVRDMSRHVIGRVKDLNSISNLRTLLTKEGFPDVKLTYLGGMWVMIELDNEATKMKLLQHIGVNSWFHVLQAAIHDFVNDERVVWVDIEGVPLNVWSRETFLKIGKKWEETMDIEENLVSSFARKRLCIKTKQSKGVAQDSDSSLSHPPGFTLEVSRQKNDHRGVDLNTETDKVNSPMVHTKVMNNSWEVHENVTSNGESAFNYSHNAHNGGSILKVLDDMIRVLIVVIYAPQPLSHKRVIWDYISSLIARWNGETTVMGDFNEVRSIDERFCLMFNQSSSRLFNHFITSSGLMDVKLEGYSFTWAHHSATKMSKLDRFLVLEGIISLLPSITALRLDRHLSDHRPILLRKIHTDYGPIPFCFYHSWFKWDGFDVVVEQAWNSFSHSDTNGLIWKKKQAMIFKVDFAKAYDSTTSDGIFKGIQIQGSMAISHLFYANDVIFIGEWSDSNLDNIVKILSYVPGYPSGRLKLSIGGRLTLLKSVLGASPLYNMLIYKVPKGVMKEMEAIRYGSLWYRVIQALYGASFELHPVNQSSIWCSILHEMQVLISKGFDFVSYCKKRVGDGHNTLFWYDSWVFDQPLRVRFPRLFALETDKESTVASKLGSSSVDASLQRSVRDGVERQQWDDLNSVSGSVTLSASKDRWICDLNGDGVFRVKEVRTILDDIFLPSAVDATRWVKYIHIKINVFAWRARLDRLPTRINLVRR